MSNRMSGDNDALATAASRNHGALATVLASGVLLAFAAGVWSWSGAEATQAEAATELMEARLAFDTEKAARRERDESLFQAFVATRIREHDARLTIARHALNDAVKDYFEGCKVGVPVFADKALTFTNRVRSAFFTDSYKQILNDLLAQHVISPGETATAITAHCDRYLATVADEEASLIRDVEARIEALPELCLHANLDQPALTRVLREGVDRIAHQAGVSQWVTLGGFVLTRITPRFLLRGLPQMSREANAAITSSLLISLSRMLSMTTSSDQVQSDALRLCDRMKEVLIHGDETAWTDFQAIQEVLKTDPDPENKRQAEQIIRDMRNNGHLGLDELLRFIQDRKTTLKSRIILSLGGIQP
jgi:hypothetical protein